MSDMPAPARPVVVKFFTIARRFPQLIGRTPDGARIWGGPYSFTQVIVGALVLFVGVKTMSLWEIGSPLQSGALLLAGTWGLVWALGKMPLGSRNPLLVVAGGIGAMASPRLGRYRGRGVNRSMLKRPHRVRARITVLRGPLLAGAPDTATRAATSAAPREAPVETPPRQTVRNRRDRSRDGRDRGHKARPNLATGSRIAAGPQLTGIQAALASTARTSTARVTSVPTNSVRGNQDMKECV